MRHILFLNQNETIMSFFIQAAHAAPEAAGGIGGLFGQLLLPIAFFAIFYFLIIRPQSKRTKEHRAMIEALTVGSEVIFAGGLMGRIKKLEGDYAVVSLNNNTDIKVQRASVLSVLPAGTIESI
jgi:preprotein translocase subunit YajC